MDKQQIENRIKGLTAERASLEATHNALVQQNQQLNQEFQQKVVLNQTRFAQLSGAIAELTQLITPVGTNNKPVTLAEVLESGPSTERKPRHRKGNRRTAAIGETP